MCNTFSLRLEKGLRPKKTGKIGVRREKKTQKTKRRAKI
jgi:hypothetical protein